MGPRARTAFEITRCMSGNQKLIVVCLGIVLVAGTLGFDWADTLFPSAEAHGVQAQLQSRFVLIEDETFSRQSMQTGEILTVQGRLVSLVERDLHGWVSILFSESADSGNRWEIVGRDPPGNVFDIAGNSVILYSVSARALEEGVYHVHTQLNVATVGPGLGPGQTVVVEGEPITRPAPPGSTATTVPSGGASDDTPVVQTDPEADPSSSPFWNRTLDDIPVVWIDPEAETSALAEGYDLRQIANVSGHLPDLVVVGEILTRESGITSLVAIYTQHPSNLELPDTVVLAIQLSDSPDMAGYAVQIPEYLLSSVTPDILQEIMATDEFVEMLGSYGEAELTEWATDPLDAAGLGDHAFRLTIGGSVEGQEFQVHQIVFSRDRLLITVLSDGISEEDTMAVAAELDSRAAQVVQLDAPTTTAPTYEARLPLSAWLPLSDMQIVAAAPAAGIGPYADLQGADLVGAHLQAADLFEADLSGASLQHADLSGASLQAADLVGAHLQAADLSGASLLNADLSGAHLRYAALSNVDLRGANLTGVDLFGTTLSGVELFGANLTGADLSGADLSGADLLNADLSGASLRGAALSNADLRGASLLNADLSGASLLDANLKRADLRGAALSNADLQGANLGGADLYGVDLSGTDLRGAHLKKTDLYGVDLSGADLRRVDLRGADLFDINFSDTYLQGADLSGANLTWADLSGAHLQGANLSGANLTWADLSGAHLQGANLSGANLTWADLSGAHLQGANLSGADLRGANLRHADLLYADLSGADLQGADFGRANLSRVDLTDIRGVGDFTGAWTCDTTPLPGATLFPCP